MRFFLISSLLLGSLLAARPSYAQYQPTTAQLQARQPYRSQQSTVETIKRITVQPTIPIDSDGSIKLEQDSITRRLYARNKVRTVLKLRLDSKGEVQDTVEYQLVDEQGRLRQVGVGQKKLRRQWSYNSQGLCTALVEHPAPNRPFTVIHTYNPALRRGQQQLVQPDGKPTVISEKQVYQNGDTLLTEITAHGLMVGQYVYPEYYQRSIRLTPHPDTVLMLTCFYNQKQEPTSYQTNYLVYRQGQLLETGQLNLSAATKVRDVNYRAGEPGFPEPTRLLAALRHGQGLQPQHRRYYDQQKRLLRQEAISREGGQEQVVQYTYNNLDQLIGREGKRPTAAHYPSRSMYAVFSYSPSGLLLGETTDARSAKPVFYRYQYQYYE
jgi:hypothetical protein